MTIGFLTDDYFPHFGGMGRYVYEVTKRLPLELLVFSPCDNTVSNHIKVTPLFHGSFKNLSYSMWLHRNVNQLVRKYRLSTINLQCGPGGLFLLKDPGVPVIATCHHTWWQQSRYISTQVWKKIFLPLEKQTYHRADRIICDVPDSKNILIDYYGVPSEKIVVIPIGVDRSQFYPIEPIQKIPDSLLYIGRIDKRKGIDFLIKAMPLVVKKMPDIKLFVGGTGKDLPNLKSFVKNQHLENNVKFLGFVPEDELNTWYNNVQGVIVPSIFEGFGLTVIEAMAAGTCVIATDVDALRNTVNDGRNGFLVKYNDRLALCDKIISLLTHKTKQKEFIAQGLHDVKSIYNWDKIIEQVVEAHNFS